MKIPRFVRVTVGVLIVYAILYEAVWKWGICRRYVSDGQSMLVMYRGNLLWSNPPSAEEDFAKVDEHGRPLERGFLKEMVGPGRHFQFDPIHYKVDYVNDVIIEPGQVGLVTSKLGKNLPGEAYLVEGDVGKTEYKGVLRKLLKPGRYRINPYGYKVAIVGQAKSPPTPANAPPGARPTGAPPSNAVSKQSLAGKKSGWVEVPTGFVGVVTNLTFDTARGLKPGIQENVLQPGIYVVNQHEQQIDIVEVGFVETTINADLSKDKNGRIVLDENGEPALEPGGDQGINFPSNDGFPIVLDFTCIWGILPEQAPKVVRLFGNVEEIRKTVVDPEIESICRIHGSKLGAVELLTGQSREKFQTDVSDDFRKVLTGANLSLQVGLVRHIYIPAQVRGPIQKANIADEIKLTRNEEIKTAQAEANLKEAKAQVSLEEQTVVSETEKLFQEAMAIGKKEVGEIGAETEKLVAVIARKTAESEAKAVLVRGQATAEVEKLKREAEAQKFELAVQAFGSPDAYNQWVFATGLPADLSLTLLYAGEGTLWTDLKSFQDAALGKMVKTATSAP